MKLAVQPGADDRCALAEQPDATYPCHAFPPMSGLGQRGTTTREDGVIVLHPPFTTLQVDGELRGVRLWTDTADPIEPDPSRPRFSPERIQLELIAPRADGSRGFTAHVVVDGRAELWFGDVVGGPPFQQTVTVRRPRPVRDVVVVDTLGEPVDHAIVYAWDPFLHTVESALADADGHVTLPTDETGRAWVADGPRGPDWTPLPSDVPTWVVPSLPPPPPGVSLHGTWATSPTDAFTLDAAPDGHVAIAEGLWRTDGPRPTLFVAIEGALVDVGPTEVARYQARPDLAKAAADRSPPAPFPDLPTLHHSEVEPKRRVNPSYPEMAQSLKLDAKCFARVAIDANGLPMDVRVGGCPSVLHAATRDALLQWVWFPAKVGRKTRAVQTVIVVTYKVR